MTPSSTCPSIHQRLPLFQRQASVSAGNLDGRNSQSVTTIVCDVKRRATSSQVMATWRNEAVFLPRIRKKIVAIVNTRVSSITCSGTEFYIPIANRHPTSPNKFPVGEIACTVDNGQIV